MVHSFRVMSLMDRHSSVDDLLHDRLFLDDGLHMLMDVVVYALTRQDRHGSCGVSRLMSEGRALVLCCIPLELVLQVSLVAVVEGLVLHGDDVVRMFLGAGDMLVRTDCKEV